MTPIILTAVLLAFASAALLRGALLLVQRSRRS